MRLIPAARPIPTSNTVGESRARVLIAATETGEQLRSILSNVILNTIPNIIRMLS